MAKKILVVVAVLVVAGISVLGQAKPSIQGVWRQVEITSTNPVTPAGGFSKGTHTNMQPGLLVFTGKHYTIIRDTGTKPRPTTAFKVADKPTAEEMLAAWGPLQAGSGTYELSGTTLTTRNIVSKTPSLQGKGLTRYTIKLDSQNLWATVVENMDGKVEYPVTIKYVRVE